MSTDDVGIAFTAARIWTSWTGWVSADLDLRSAAGLQRERQSLRAAPAVVRAIRQARLDRYPDARGRQARRALAAAWDVSVRADGAGQRRRRVAVHAGAVAVRAAADVADGRVRPSPNRPRRPGPAGARLVGLAGPGGGRLPGRRGGGGPGAARACEAAAVYLCNPQNPTGRVLPVAEVAALAGGATEPPEQRDIDPGRSVPVAVQSLSRRPLSVARFRRACALIHQRARRAWPAAGGADGPGPPGYTPGSRPPDLDRQRARAGGRSPRAPASEDFVAERAVALAGRHRGTGRRAFTAGTRWCPATACSCWPRWVPVPGSRTLPNCAGACWSNTAS